ncbi:hypothetical protein PN498_11130 [Oscillatoria sp. CS-180]|uniref:hypothetical protein n=1 Tax=Oscillatoria sp. CS-180 TaxID=3021720 RepID=UPI00232D651F|nr:hypothetical protein [Oscillatoria sp. CS-180]MDB9526544.1 hypothetical protein [Oscillatoria sp. CS-180]
MLSRRGISIEPICINVEDTMDDLQQQIQTLIQDAPDDGVTGPTVEAIAPVLLTFASGLKHAQYYVLQTLNQNWVMTTLGNRKQPNTRKNVLYGFPTLKDAASDPLTSRDPQIMAIPTPVTRILFQMLALKSLDSVIFFDTPGNLKQGTEVRRQDFQAIVQAHLKESQGYIDPNANIG